jgi:hypothetical protein
MSEFSKEFSRLMGRAKPVLSEIRASQYKSLDARAMNRLSGVA